MINSVSKYTILDKTKNLFLADVWCIGYHGAIQAIKYKFTFTDKIDMARMGTKKDMLRFLELKYINNSKPLINSNDLEIKEIKINYEY